MRRDQDLHHRALNGREPAGTYGRKLLLTMGIRDITLLAGYRPGLGLAIARRFGLPS
jgi:hypothetical protein